MNQQINLYQEDLFGKKEPLPAKVLLLVVGLVLLALGAWYGFAWWQLAQLNRESARVEEEVARKTEEVARLQLLYPAPQKDPQLEGEIARLEMQRQWRQPLLARVAALPRGGAAGFSPFLTALARQPMSGLWLNGISIAAAGVEIALEGSAMQPEHVPRFLQQLTKEKAFTGIEFRHCQMTREEGKTERINFKLRTRNEEER